MMMKDSLRNNRQMFVASGILPLWHDKTFDDFVNDPQAKQRVLKYLEKHSEAAVKGYGLFLYGDNGVGKTHLMMCLLKSLCALRYGVRSITLGTLIKLYTQENWHGMHNEFTQILQKPRFLEIEEIGKEYKSGENDLGRTVLDSVVRFRLQMKKPILFTTNNTPGEIEDIYSHDVASMLFECVVPVKVQGNDFRASSKFKEMKNNLGI